MTWQVGDDSLRQVEVIDVGVDAGQRALDARESSLIATLEQGLPAAGSWLAGECGFERAEVEARDCTSSSASQAGSVNPPETTRVSTTWVT